MFNLSPRIALPLLVAVVVVALAAFTPGPASTPTVEARCGAHYGGYVVIRSEITCNTWDFGCWINPNEPDNINIRHERICRDMYDENWRYCGTRCYDKDTRLGCCE